MKAEIKVHFKKKETQINIKVPLTQEEREIINKCIISLIEKLKVDNSKIILTTPYKKLPKERKELKEIEVSIENNEESLDKLLSEIEAVNKEIEEWLDEEKF